MFGASSAELALAAILVVVVLLAQIAPRIGEAIGALFERPGARADQRPASEQHQPQGPAA